MHNLKVDHGAQKVLLIGHCLHQPRDLLNLFATRLHLALLDERLNAILHLLAIFEPCLDTLGLLRTIPLTSTIMNLLHICVHRSFVVV